MSVSTSPGISRDSKMRKAATFMMLKRTVVYSKLGSKTASVGFCTAICEGAEEDSRVIDTIFELYLSHFRI